MPDQTYPTTRRALHGVAELVLAGPQFRRSATIRLRVVPGGFATVADPALRVEGTDLVSGDQRYPLDGSTCADLAAAVGVDVGAPGNYADGAGVAPDDRIAVDPASAAALATALTAGDTAMRAFAPDQTPVLWPEHFDVGITVDEINYGVSPGDATIAEPYAYVAPWQRRTGEFWNVPFGAARTVRDLGDAAGIEAFFRAGRAEAAAGRHRDTPPTTG
jgi:hypothetical protein